MLKIFAPLSGLKKHGILDAIVFDISDTRIQNHGAAEGEGKGWRCLWKEFKSKYLSVKYCPFL